MYYASVVLGADAIKHVPLRMGLAITPIPTGIGEEELLVVDEPSEMTLSLPCQIRG